MDGEIETVKFLYYGHEYLLRADSFHAKGYPMTVDGRMEKKDDILSDAYMHTIHNRQEVEASQTCYCIDCQTAFHPSEIECYADGGTTAICPNCDCDAVIGNACGLNLSDELLEQLHKRYFNY